MEGDLLDVVGEGEGKGESVPSSSEVMEEERSEAGKD